MSSSSGVGRKRPSAPTDNGAQYPRDGESGAEGGGGGGGGGGGKCPGNPYEFDDDGMLSSQQEQMLRVLQRHKNLLNPKQREVYEKLRRKASKASLPPFTTQAQGDTPSKGPEEKRLFQDQTKSNPSNSTVDNLNAGRYPPGGVGFGCGGVGVGVEDGVRRQRRSRDAGQHRNFHAEESHRARKEPPRGGTPSSGQMIPSTTPPPPPPLAASSLSVSPSPSSSSRYSTITFSTTKNQGSSTTPVAKVVPYLHKPHHRQPRPELDLRSCDASVTDADDRGSSTHGESPSSSYSSSSPSSSSSSSSHPSSAADPDRSCGKISPPSHNPSPHRIATHRPSIPVSRGSSHPHRFLQPPEKISMNSGDKNTTATPPSTSPAPSSSSEIISSSSSSSSVLPQRQTSTPAQSSPPSQSSLRSSITSPASSPISYSPTRPKTQATTTTKTFPKPAGHVVGGSPSSAEKKKNDSSSAVVVAQRTEPTSSSFAYSSPSDAPLSDKRGHHVVSPINAKHDIYDFSHAMPTSKNDYPSAHHHPPLHVNNNHSPSQKLATQSKITAATIPTTTTTTTIRDAAASVVKSENEWRHLGQTPEKSFEKRESKVSFESTKVGDSPSPKSHSDGVTQTLLPTLKLSIKKLDTSSKYKVDVNATSRAVIEGALASSKDDQFNDLPDLCLTVDGAPLPKNGASNCAPVPREKLNPPTPSVIVTTKKEALSSALYNVCLSQPIAVLRGYASALKLDLGLFSTRTLVEVDSYHPVEVRTQRQQKSEENWDALGQEKVWLCTSSRSHSSVGRYAMYQANSFQESLTGDAAAPSSAIVSDVANDETDPTTTSSPSKEKAAPNLSNKVESCEDGAEPSLGGPGTDFKIIKFGTNVDLSDEKKWRPQLRELQKLPPFFRLVSPCNMLSHVGFQILGMNSVQLYMKVPGSRTPGHQENNNMCSVNLNIGPGDCEWFAVDEPYWGIVHDLCEKHGVNYLIGSWWPILEELFELGIPVYRFLQSPGDIVWLSPGTIHWVQAVGWCNNIAWNVGPLTHYQYRIAMERYEFNKYYRVKSIVPMLHLSWNLAKNLKISDPSLWGAVRSVLQRSLRHMILTIELVKKIKDKTTTAEAVHFQRREKGECAYYCALCEVEVFNVLFAKEDPTHKNYVVHCFDCSRKMSPSLSRFVVLTQFTTDQLSAIYDNFTLTNPDIANAKPKSDTSVSDFTVVPSPGTAAFAGGGSTGSRGLDGLVDSLASTTSSSGNQDAYHNLVKPCSIKLEPAKPTSKFDNAGERSLTKFDQHI